MADTKFERGIAAGLTRAYEDKATGELTVQLDTLRLIVFSDLHKGSRDGADDFRRCERAYNAALAYYYEAGHTLYALGDVEELWECDPDEVLPQYERTLELEKAFYAAGRYERFWGNHDDLWRHPDAVKKRLGRYYDDRLQVREALKLHVTSAEASGTIFFVHGHQGTADSDKWGWFSRIVVRRIWRPLQRKVKFASTTPATDWDLRQEHETAMFKWAKANPGRFVMISGHTHRPVFGSSAPPADVADTQTPAAIEWNRAEERRVDKPTEIVPPCYFNTGCCSFGDGDITGIEIFDGDIRLVRWPDKSDEPKPEILATLSLRKVLDDVAGPH